jgi:para-nitrobenzyl esterase
VSISDIDSVNNVVRNFDSRDLEVAIATGRVKGQVDSHGVARFLGIPYAEPPIGELRFRPTAPKAPWRGVLDATRFGPAAAQYFDPLELPIVDIQDGAQAADRPAFVGSEDALTLNIWTALPDFARKPVIVWIHGGANWLESSRLTVYHGDRFARSKEVVFVSLNYRLGPFGFLDLSVLGGEAWRGGHSNGLRDQLTALHWVRDHIAAFGGDPENITLMGESAGSMDISWLLASDRLRGLVRRIVLMSGVASVRGFAMTEGNSAHSAEYGRRDAAQFFELLGIDSLSQLLALDTAALLDRLAAAVPARDMLFYWDSIFYPRVDPSFAPVTPFEYVAKGSARAIDMLIGSTAYEMGLWLTWDPSLNRQTVACQAARLECLDARQRDGAVALYDRCFATQPEGARGMHLLGDAMFVMPGVQLAESHAETGGRSWLYQFSWEIPGSPMRASHAADVPFFFDNAALPAAEALLGSPRTAVDAAARQRLSRQMHHSLISFARHGDPGMGSDRSSISWPVYDRTHRRTMMFDAETSLQEDPFGERRVWWQSQVYLPVLRR